MGEFYVEIERPSSRELQCAVRFDVFVYVYDFAHLGDVIGRWLAWLALMQ